MNEGNVDGKFNEIVLNDLRSCISMAFIDLNSKLRVNSLEDTIDSRKFINEKARQMKKELNAFIDGQANSMIRD